MTLAKLLTHFEFTKEIHAICTGQEWHAGSSANILNPRSPATGQPMAKIKKAESAQMANVVDVAHRAFLEWRAWPAPVRGEVVRQLGNEFRKQKKELGALISYEMGKSYREGEGEVQEIIDICDFAVGLSRQLYGLSMHSERSQHRMYEQWHPLGVVGVITAFNFPAAVWAWNMTIGTICGDTIVWKPSEKTPLTAVACQKIIAKVLRENQVPEGVFNMVLGDRDIGEALTANVKVPLISATGSVPMGKSVAQVVASRLGRSLLELGGNNAVIISPNADLKLALPSIVFGAIGTAGQRCTSVRRVFVHASIYQKVRDGLVQAYQSLRIGSPLDDTNHMGPLVDEAAVEKMQTALLQVVQEGGRLLYGGEKLSGPEFESGCYVRPALVEVPNQTPTVQEETFAPIVYLMKYETLDEAIELQNSVRQGLSSSMFTNHLREAEYFLSQMGSDCGIANINMGTSGAEIGGAFGGEKETGGGRESGSDSWKAYMRRQTSTINFGESLNLAQGIKFDI